MNPQAYYKRIAGILEPGRLRSRRVAVIGLGSGGSRVAAELARLGTELLLVERPQERLEEHNLVRHLLGYPSLGKLKLGEMLRHLRRVNPWVRVRGLALDVADEPARLEERLRAWQPNLLAVCTDNQRSKHAVNQVALRLGVPQVGAGVYDGGIGGEAWRVLPGQACYGCLAAQLQLLDHTPAPAGTPDYNHFDPKEVAPACALGLDIEQIVILQCRMALEILLGDTSGSLGVGPDVNLWVFANRVVPGTFARPLHCQFFRVPRQADCLLCGQTSGEDDAEAGRILASVGIGKPSRPPRAGRPGNGRTKRRPTSPTPAGAEASPRDLRAFRPASA